MRHPTPMVRFSRDIVYVSYSSRRITEDHEAGQTQDLAVLDTRAAVENHL